MNSTSLLPKIGLGIIVVVIAGYAVFRFTPILSGPELVLVSPATYSTTTENSIDIVLATERVTGLRIQGLDVDVNKNTDTVYSYQLAAGVNRIRIQAQDKYESSKDIEILVVKNSGKL